MRACVRVCLCARVRACVHVCVCVVSVIVKRPVLSPSVVDGRSRNPLYYYYYYYFFLKMCDLATLSLTINEALTWLSSLPILMQESL